MRVLTRIAGLPSPETRIDRPMSRSRVGLAQQGNRRDNVFQAMDLVRDDLIPKIADQVMLKPNFLTNTNQLASSHPDAMRGAIDFLLSCPQPPSEILIAEGGNEDYSGQCFEVASPLGSPPAALPLRALSALRLSPMLWPALSSASPHQGFRIRTARVPSVVLRG